MTSGGKSDMKTQQIAIQRIESEVKLREAKQQELVAKQQELGREIQIFRDAIELLLASPSYATDNAVTDIDQGQKVDTVTDQITDAVYQVLLAERPLHRGVIAERLQAMGIHLGGKVEKDRIQYLASFLSRDQRFNPVGREDPTQRGNWTLVDAPTYSMAALGPAIKANNGLSDHPQCHRVDSDMFLHGDASDTDYCQDNVGCQ